MNKKPLLAVAIFFSGSCTPTFLPQNSPKETSQANIGKPAVSELIDGHYYCYPGCNGHKNKTSICKQATLEKELTRRLIAFYIEDTSTEIRR